MLCTDHTTNAIMPAGKTPGLRTSCDRCQVAKVRCSRSKPACWRCSQSGQECVYSPLKRTGRPRKHSGCPTVFENRGNANLHAQNNPDTQVTQQRLDGRKANVDSISNGQWQATGLPQEEQNDPIYDWNTCDLDVRDATLDGFDRLDPNPAVGDIPWPRDVSDGSNFSWNAGGTNDWTTSEVASPDFSALLLPSAKFPGDGLPSPFRETEPGVSSMTSSNLLCDLPVPQLLPRTNLLRTDFQSTDRAISQWRIPKPPGAFEPENIVPQEVAHLESHPCCRSKNQCYEALSGVLFHLNDKALESEHVYLDELLGLDRDLQRTAKRALACQYCMESHNGHTTIMLVFMALDSIVSLFEKQRDAAPVQSSISETPQFLQLAKALVVGNFMVENRVKNILLRQLVLGFLDNLGSILSQVERRVGIVSRGVYRRMADEMADDMRRRASLLRGWIHLSTQI